MRSELSIDEARTLASELIRRRRLLDAEELAWSIDAAALVASRYHELDGSATGLDWLRHNCKMGRGTVADRVCVGEQIDKLPESADALEEGEIGFAHLVVLARTAEAVAVNGGDAFDETALLDKAREESVGRFHFTCENYRHACNPEAFAAEAENLYEQRELSMRRRRDGMVTLWGRLDPVGAATIRSALKPFMKRRGKEDRRSFKQRLHDAAVEQAGGCAPAQVNVTVAAETLLGLAGAPAAYIEQSPISIRTLERLTCDCSVRRIVLDPGSVVIEVGRSRRVVSPAGRAALEARDNGCVWPGCERVPSWCTPHHLVHWARGGSTDLPNQALLCGFHHRLVHEGRWQIVKLDDGQVLTLRPPPLFSPLAREPDAESAA
jgi:hypothetical protein